MELFNKTDGHFSSVFQSAGAQSRLLLVPSTQRKKSACGAGEEQQATRGKVKHMTLDLNTSNDFMKQGYTRAAC